MKARADFVRATRNHRDLWNDLCQDMDVQF
jgi:hypothetical protein